MTIQTITIDTDQWAVVPVVPNDKLRSVLLEWCSTVESAWFDILAAATSTQPEQAQQSDDLTIAYMAGLHDGRKQAAPRPVPTSERLPTEADYDFECRLWVRFQTAGWCLVYKNGFDFRFATHWQDTGLVRPAEPGGGAV